MKFKLKIDIPEKRIETFCKKWKVKELSLFGSVLTLNFKPESDIDILYIFLPEAKWSLFDVVAMREELMGIFGRGIDLVSKNAIKRSRNHFRKDAILENTKVIYDKAA